MDCRRSADSRLRSSRVSAVSTSSSSSSALSSIPTTSSPIFESDDTVRARLREAADHTTRYIEDLDAARDRAAVTYEELSNRLAEQMNETMYRLSIVAAIFDRSWRATADVQ
jgi:zinc transporter